MNYYIGMDIKDFDMGSAVIDGDYKAERARRFRAAKERALRNRNIRLKVLVLVSFAACFVAAFSLFAPLFALVSGIVGGLVLSIIAINLEFVGICVVAAHCKKRSSK